MVAREAQRMYSTTLHLRTSPYISLVITVVAREAQRMYSTTRSTLVSQNRSVVPLSAWLVLGVGVGGGVGVGIGLGVGAAVRLARIAAA